MYRNKLHFLAFLICATGYAQNSAPALARVTAQRVQRTVEIPAEIFPYLATPIEARVAGYVDQVLVDRGSAVKKGELLVQLSAPEMEAQVAAAESKVQLAKAEESQAEAQLAAAQSTYERTKEASQTPGAIAGNELIQAEKQRDAAKGLVSSRQGATEAAQSALKALQELSSYLHVAAPFDGIITDRYVHPGTLVQASTSTPLLKLQQISRLRVTVPVPEQYVSAIVKGTPVDFHVSAWPNRRFSGKIARIAHSLDEKSRTMNIELDVWNRDGSLAPGMYPIVSWPVAAGRPLLVVPASSVVTTTERMFVIKDENGRAHRVDIKKQEAGPDRVAVTGDLKPGDFIVARATDEIREGAPLPAPR